MSTQSIERQDLKVLYELPNVCEKYKAKIRKYLSDHLFDDIILIKDSDIEFAFNEGLPSHKRVLLKYFKLAEKKSPKNFKEILKHFDMSESDLNLIKDPDNAEEISRNDYARLLLAVKYYNGDWKPNWNETNEYKWYVYFYKSRGRWVVGVYSHYNLAHRPSGVYFKNKEGAEHSAKILADIYKGYLMIK